MGDRKSKFSLVPEGFLFWTSGSNSHYFGQCLPTYLICNTGSECFQKSTMGGIRGSAMGGGGGQKPPKDFKKREK